MFEVLLTGFGVFVFGVTQGISAGYEVTRPFRVFGFTGLLAALSWRELRIGTHTKLERHTWTLRGRTSEYFDDSVAVSSPTYLVDNLPVYVLAFCFPFTTVGCGVWLATVHQKVEGRQQLMPAMEKFRRLFAAEQLISQCKCDIARPTLPSGVLDPLSSIGGAPINHLKPF
ncbi:hypothetical protein FOZ60_004319 [Perkinsus olseni]|uniref:Uncharacterized protein n=1 Tax=Perkinsus olseni TaxID=32597 RepID=A0A7J6NU68_PEROL|nr:hypothetical protein FOZ60_004319 [Perkinsus olseni]